MNIKTRVFTAFAALCVGLCLCVAPLVAHAEPAESDSYSYTITVYPGDGTLDGASIWQHPYQINDKADLSEVVKSAVPADSRYFVKGIRLAGHDNADLAAQQFTVKGDAQYVITYGLQKDMVAYTVNFVDEDGNQLAESETFYGVAGDKPVVAYRYIEQYLPNAYNLTKTLSDDPNENTFTFVYRSVPGINYVTVPGEAPEGAAPGAGVNPADAAAVEAAAAAGEIIGEDGNPLAAPQEIVDIDDDENPLAQGNNSSAGLLENPAAIVGIIAGIAILAAIIIALVRRNRKNAQDQSAA